MYRTHIDNAAGVLLVHLAQGCTGGQQGAVEVDREHPLPFREVEVDDGGDDLDASIADEEWQSPNVSITFAVPVSTWLSSTTSMETPITRVVLGSIFERPLPPPPP
jgi:hypothetical protein